MVQERRVTAQSVPAFRARLRSGVLLTLLALSGAPAAWLIVRGQGTLAVTGFLLAILYLTILVRWPWGVYGLVVFLPFSGVLTLALYPWRGPALLNPVLYKDWLFVLPAYLGFLAALMLRRIPRPPVERLAVWLLLLIILVVAVQMANPGVANVMVALIGAKVWLFYVPLYFLGAAVVTRRHDLVVLLRVFVVVALIPCMVGIAENIVAHILGYQRVMEAIYGAAAFGATQQFTSYEIGSGWIERIPSTFTFVSQFFSFTWAMMVPCYALGRLDSSPGWKRFGQAMLVVSAVAGLLSGTRAAFVFVPLLVALMYGLDRGFRGFLRAGIYAGAVVVAALAVSRSSVVALYELIAELSGMYAENTAYGGLVRAITASPFGSGTGTNTGAARYALGRPELYSTFENYYARAAYELGIVGLLLVLALFAALIWYGLRTTRRAADPGLRACAAALTAFLIALGLYSFKGEFIDMDPINVYFWMYAGFLSGLPAVDATLAVRLGQPRHEYRGRRTVAQPTLAS